MAYLGGFLQVPGVVFLDVVMRADDVFQLVVDDHAGALGAHAAREQHHPRASVRVRALQHTAHNTITDDRGQFKQHSNDSNEVLKQVQLPATRQHCALTIVQGVLYVYH